ncbi:hypothetical protein SAMN05660909_00924 [Chitinophaga terrae (ex Kim and Jung 2007)]|uniref:Uncharacterized protein n=1 Tax=Chitinophaga terrae (ex Kim and Jung 2007) TaxID=408074 RepID=A0A1H3YS98_9BACT|nr:hypothetical protein [Chitinophaga terrae (ex Kim and Jung 2007)]GEP88463.1 hypothetical protein CTE07_01080 [Chitinophaga terrae (ex Kim and Jung 2007)]SEA14051.1 hypothetical protein SAMN05660909_00924 [Chitinophaga terrae (ex Kim and Jung 2007)]
MNSYFKIVADRLWLKKLPDSKDEETRELIKLMDNIPNARSVATLYQKMNRGGKVDKQYMTKDPAAKWLEMEQYVINREVRRRDTQQKLIFMAVLFLILGLTSYLYGLQWLANHEPHAINTTIKHH